MVQYKIMEQKVFTMGYDVKTFLTFTKTNFYLQNTIFESDQLMYILNGP